jgi:hypothetical protein
MSTGLHFRKKEPNKNGDKFIQRTIEGTPNTGVGVLFKDVKGFGDQGFELRPQR